MLAGHLRKDACTLTFPLQFCHFSCSIFIFLIHRKYALKSLLLAFSLSSWIQLGWQHFHPYWSSRQTFVEHWKGGARLQALQWKMRSHGHESKHEKDWFGYREKVLQEENSEAVKQAALLEVFKVPDKTLNTLVSSHSHPSWSRRLAKRPPEVPSSISGVVNWPHQDSHL